jgi:cell pole-organizing protein PopZ
MNFPGGNRGKRNDEMTMEDILSSIRKYVSEEESGKNEAPTEKINDVPDSGQFVPDADSNVINLGADDVANHSEPPVAPGISQPPPSRGDSLRYVEQSDLAEEVITIPSRPGPFDKLTNALKSYGKPAPKGGEKPEMEMIFNFFRSIVEEKVDKWLEDNMLAIVEGAVLREIEKIKAEG